MKLNKRSSVVAPLLGCLLFFGILLAGCSPAEETESEVQEAVEEPVEVIEVNETEFSLDPAEITLER
ncbi:MAG TPA: hypothetical protein VFE09_07415, partial [Rubrobacteraceae bacterium]|nr:hypothetical protein [Rubrobacteraceae bacterium]